MKRKALWLLVSCLMALSLVIVSCGQTAVEEEEAKKGEEKEEIVEEKEEIVEEKEEIVEEKEKVTAPGEPQYGGVITHRFATDPTAWDPYFTFSVNPGQTFYESLAMPNWMDDELQKTVDFTKRFLSSDWETGRLAESWEVSDDGLTITFQIRQGVKWQNIPPMNGRELIAADIAFSYHRHIGLGSGYSKGTPFVPLHFWRQVVAVTATDKYTLVFELTEPSWEMLRTILDDAGMNTIVPREAIELWGDVNDWRHVIGTGPFILKDYVAGSSIELARNPNYWGYDENYPDNQLPYVDTVRILIIPDTSTALAALRAGKLDRMNAVSWEDMATLRQTSPELVERANGRANAVTLNMRVDNKPFDDIRVRSALQMAIDLETIAATYYGGSVPGTPVGAIGFPGWIYPYEEWPQELRNRYLYNPEEAKKLLAEAGYPDGFKTEVVAQTTDDIDLLQVIAAYFADIDVEITIKTMEPGAWTSYKYAGKMEQMSVALRGNYSTVPAGPKIAYYTAGHRDSAATGLNDPYMNELYDKVNAAATEAEMNPLVREADRYIIDQQWQVSLLPIVTYLVEQPWLMGGKPSSDVGLGQVLARLWLDQELKKSGY